MNRKSSIRAILLRKECLLFFLLLLPMFTKAQYNKVYADITANMLVDMGFENVVWSEDEKERVYVLENTPWRLQGVGLAHAIDRIQKTGLPEKGKSCLPVRYCWVILPTSFWTNGFMPRRHPIIWHA